MRGEATRFDFGYDTAHGTIASMNLAYDRIDDARGAAIERHLVEAASRMPNVTHALLVGGLFQSKLTTSFLLAEGHVFDAHWFATFATCLAGVFRGAPCPAAGSGILRQRRRLGSGRRRRQSESGPETVARRAADRTSAQSRQERPFMDRGGRSGEPRGHGAHGAAATGLLRAGRSAVLGGRRRSSSRPPFLRTRSSSRSGTRSMPRSLTLRFSTSTRLRIRRASFSRRFAGRRWCWARSPHSGSRSPSSASTAPPRSSSASGRASSA